MSDNAIRLFKGWVQHKRVKPQPHSFRYRYFQIWLDVEQEGVIDILSSFWSSKKLNLVRYRRQNYLPDDDSLYDTICRKIKQETNQNFQGKAYLLGSLSYWGYCYNPVCFYFCYNEERKLEYILSEIHNTPWGERFTYVHNLSKAESDDQLTDPANTDNHRSGHSKFKFEKQFHVSPFMPMNINYDWTFNITPNKVIINMNLQQDNNLIFNAAMNLTNAELNTQTARKIALRYPFMCINVLFAIYWQAFRLWLKKTPFYGHPNK